MTSYLASGGVQWFTITIASGQTTGTASISAVGSGAFMVWQGETTTDSTTTTSAEAVLSISGTTVTATRAASSTDTITVNGAIVDGDTTNLVKSVQYGSLTIGSAATTNTASITAVTNNNTAIFYLGQSTTAGVVFTRSFAAVSLSGTTVTATRGATGSTVTVGFVVVEFQGTALQSATQAVSIATAAGTSFTGTITGVSTSNSMIAYGGTVDAISADTRALSYGILTNSTTITSNYGASVGAGGSYKCTVIEFIPGIFTIQRGTISISAGTSNTATITSSATASTLCNWLGNKSDITTGVLNTAISKITQTNATTLTMTVNSSASPTGSYEVIGFFSPPPSTMDFGMGMVV